MQKLTKNFNREEFDCKDGTKVPDHLLCNVIILAGELQIIRDFLGEPIHLNSGYRTSAYNKKVGGAKDSQHLKAKAADITTKTKSPKQLKAVVEKLIKEGKLHYIKGIGLYPGFLHVDIRENKARW